MFDIVVLIAVAVYLIDRIIQWTALYSQHFGTLKQFGDNAELLNTALKSQVESLGRAQADTASAVKHGHEWRDACIAARQECAQLRERLKEVPSAIAN